MLSHNGWIILTITGDDGGGDDGGGADVLVNRESGGGPGGGGGGGAELVGVGIGATAGGGGAEGGGGGGWESGITSEEPAGPVGNASLKDVMSGRSGTNVRGAEGAIEGPWSPLYSMSSATPGKNN